MTDVIVVGAGPAGCVAAIVLARAGARVRLLDRSRFPRRKLCGDSVNPGARAILRRLGLARAIESAGIPVRGMIVSGGGTSIRGEYPPGHRGIAIARAVMDQILVDTAAKAGVEIDEGTLVASAVVERHAGVDRVRGVRVKTTRRTGPGTLRAPVCIAADGRHSRLAFELGLSAHPPHPRRWAVGAYYVDVDGTGDCGEMHVREEYYVGVARVPGDLVNACLVTGDRTRLKDPERALREALEADPLLRDRFARARRVAPVVTLGPLAVDARAAGMPGLLMAGDAAGFVDPMTGDGLRFAFRGGELAARAALLALERGEPRAHLALARWHREFRAKRAFNRALRRLVDSPRGIAIAAAGARVAPAVLRRIISLAGDLPAARAA
jgi:geranylgeranyl reductase family protein